MKIKEFTIRKAFLVPLGLLLLLCGTLLILCLVQQQPLAKIVILAGILLPVTILFAESSLRRVTLEEEALVVKKLLRQKRLIYPDITSVDTVLVRKRAFLSISTVEDFVILSNSYEAFDHLVKNLLEKVPPATISEETQQMAEAPPTKSSDIYSIWLAVIVLVLIIYVQLGGAF